MTKRILCLLLAIVMVLGVLPAMGTVAFAAAVDFLAIYDSQGYYVPLGSVFTMEVGQSESFRIQVFYADGSAIDAEWTEWEVDDPSAVSMTTDGCQVTVNAMAFGGTALTGTYRAEDGSVHTATIYIDIVNAGEMPETPEEEFPQMWLNIIDTRNNRNVSERGVGVNPGEELTLKVTAQYFDEREVEVRPGWKTDNSRVVRVLGNRLYVGEPGTARLSVSYTDENGYSDSTYVDVKVTDSDGYYVEIRGEDELSTSYIETTPGADFALSAVVYNQSTGGVQEDAFVLWRSGEDTMVEVNVEGHVWVHNTGHCWLYAVYFGEDGYDYTTAVEIQSIEPVQEPSYAIITDHAMAFNADGELITSAKAGEEITVRHTGYWYQTVNNWSFEPAVAYTGFSDRLVFTMPEQDINIKVIFENTVLSNVRVTVGIPVVGREADFTAVTYAGNVMSMGYQIALPWGVTTFHNGVQWYDVTADSYLVPGDVFEAGHSYQVSVGIQAEYCHSFSTTSLTGYIPYMGNISVTGVGNQSQEEWRMLISEAVQAVEEHKVTVYNGEAFNDKGEPVTTAAMGDVLTIIAPEIPNRPFKNWEELTNTGIRFGDIIDGTEKATTVVTMPDSDLEIQAVYEKERIESLALELSGYYKGNGAHQMKLTWDNWNIVPFCENCYEDQNYVICMDNNNNPSSFLYGNMTAGPYWLRVGIRTFEEYTLDDLTEENITLTVDGVTMNTVRLERGDNNAMVLHFFLGAPVEVNWNILWITGGQAYFNGYPVDRAPAGTKIDLILEDTPLDGQTFAGWKDEFGYVTEFNVDDNNGYSFIMPDSYVSIVPVYTGAIYRVDLNMVDPPEDGMRPDYEVELPADAGYELTSDNVFNNACVNGVWWSVEYDEAGSGDVLDPETAVFDFEEGKGQFYTVSFSLAAKDGYWFATNEEGGYILEGYVDGVAANLNYPDNHTKYLGVTLSFYTRDSYSITVEGGNAYNPRQQGNTPTETPITSAYPGDYIKVVADPVEGKTFSHWQIITGAIKIAEEELANETIWFGMPEEAVALRAVYKAMVPTLTLKAPTLEFKDMITVNAMFTAENIEAVVEMGMITYTEKVDTWSVETAKYVIPGTTYDASTGRYIATSQGIHAKYLGDTVYLAVYAKLSDGTYAYSKLASYSPIQYATSQLKNSTDVKLKQLVVAMLNYGAEAQLYFGHNTDRLANASLTSNQMALPDAYRSDMVSTVASPSADKQGQFYNNKGFLKRYPSISFEGAFCINYFFTPNYTPVDGITLYYWNAADFEAVDVLAAENASGSFKMEGSGTDEYRGDITGIAAKAISQAVYVAAVYSDGTTTWASGVLGYSIGAYCSSQASKGGDIADLAMATAVYGYHAKAYFG